MNHALFIGISNYLYATNLSGPVNDCNKISTALLSRYTFDEKNIKFLFNKSATRSRIIDQLVYYRDNLSEEDTLFVYFAGHGVVSPDGQGFWVPYDGDLGSEGSLVPNINIIESVRSCSATHILLVSDSCFSGTIFRETRNGNIINQLSNLKSRYAITSGRDNQEVLDNSIFASDFLHYLTSNEDKHISAKLIADHLVEIGDSIHQIPQHGRIYGTGDKGGTYYFKLSANEESEWDSAELKNTIESYSQFLTKFPNSRKCKIANDRIDNILSSRKKWINILHNINEALETVDFSLDRQDLQYYNFAKKSVNRLLVSYANNENEESIWRECVNQDSLDSYRNYIETFPSGSYVQLANKRYKEILDEIEAKKRWDNLLVEVRSSRKIDDGIRIIKSFIFDYPHDRRNEVSAILEDCIQYKTASEENSIIELRKYTDNLQSIFRIRAKNQLNKLLQTDRIDEAIQERDTVFLKEKLDNPEVEISHEQLSKIDTLLSIESNRFKDLNADSDYIILQDFKRLYPNGRYIAPINKMMESIDRKEFNNAQHIHSIESYSYYLNSISGGIYQNDAKTAIREIEDSRNRSHVVSDGIVNFMVAYSEVVSNLQFNNTCLSEYKIEDSLKNELSPIMTENNDFLTKPKLSVSSISAEEKIHEEFIKIANSSNLVELNKFLDKFENTMYSRIVKQRIDFIKGKKKFFSSYLIYRTTILLCTVILIVICLILYLNYAKM